MSAPVRWGFLGAGRIATVAVGPAVKAARGAVLQAAAARSADRAAQLAPLGRAYGDDRGAKLAAYDQLLADDSVEAIYINLHNSAHLPWALAALAAGKHVLCEKPLADSPEEVLELQAAAAAADRLLVEATWYRWHPRTHRVLAILAERGPARQVEADFCFGNVPADDFRMNPAFGGGALADVGCYAVSAATIFLGASEFTVTSAQLDLAPSGVDLAATAALSGGTGTAQIRCGIAESDRQGVVIHLDWGTLELVAPPFTSWHQPADLRFRTSAGDQLEHFAQVDPYQLMIEAVSRRIRGEGDPHDPVHGSWVVPATESLSVASTLAAIRRLGASR